MEMTEVYLQGGTHDGETRLVDIITVVQIALESNEDNDLLEAYVPSTTGAVKNGLPIWTLKVKD